ncbi:UDP-glucuronic acid decarboxylase family protein [Sphingomonas crocodyli]|uniref:UDP-glucuronate decarboxylase n=1 Tax=Sphingomonas crocodyli TaxID=1979270 RepID=A0A437MBD3_9SPHN|nr:UDP-glucuronic acid decarboxylase family protein [Sphingomonas crocodyli]RVT94950.1 SDR family oxidoreductase [Sphingomonas crocodyli]
MNRYFTYTRSIVTGGAGFLGSHLIDYLMSHGHDVVCVDNLLTGSKNNIRHLYQHNRVSFEFVRHDVTQPLDIQADEIYNLACPASPPQYQHNAIYTMKTSVLGALNVLELARATNARILQASTSEVYGDPALHPQPESYWGNVNPIGVRSCYDEGKRAAETLFMDFRRQYNMNTKLVRIFNTYGPRMNVNDGRVISNFIVQALKGENITIYGDGSQTRSFCFVSDLVEAIYRTMNTEAEFGDPINIGNPGEFTMLELADKILTKIGGTSKLEFRPLPQDDPKQRQPDISLADSKLGWAPKVSLEDGLTETIAYFREALES